MKQEILAPADLLTLRAGELASDPASGDLAPLEDEALKIAPRPGFGWMCCKLYPETNACAIYDDRPAECRALDCRDPAELLAMYRRDRLRRGDVFGEDHPLLDLARTLDRGVAPARIRELVLDLRDGRSGASAELAPMLRLDMELRRLAVEQGVPAELLPLLLGRPQSEVLRPMGVVIRDTPQGVRIEKAPISPQGERHEG